MNKGLLTQLKCIQRTKKRDKRNQLEEREAFLAFGHWDLAIEDISFFLCCPLSSLLGSWWIQAAAPSGR